MIVKEKKSKTGILLNRRDYRDKVRGCWLGKNVGGTLGAPFEGNTAMGNVSFYTQELGGQPLPNDDLDLQMIWLLAVEKYGLRNFNERILAEYWQDFITGPWNEYGVCRNNLSLGLMPPLSGACGNDRFKWSNGAWIRSEIWACLYPGSPACAAAGAYCDACCDHEGEGVWAEIFLAAAEAAAFVEKDLGKILEIGLAYIPADSRIARSVKCAMECYTRKIPFAEARAAVVADSADIGWFQAPVNIGFVVLGLLYGEGDFGRSICLAVNCGDDTDCTGGSTGALLGIIGGASALPEKWIAPIGTNICTCSIDNQASGALRGIPKTVGELTARVVYCAEREAFENAMIPQFTDGEGRVDPDDLAAIADGSEFLKRIKLKWPYTQTFDLPFGTVNFEFPGEPLYEPGKPLTLACYILSDPMDFVRAEIIFHLPENWRSSGDLELTGRHTFGYPHAMAITPGDSSEAVVYLPVEIRVAGRFNPYVVQLPLLRRGAIRGGSTKGCKSYFNHWYFDRSAVLKATQSAYEA